MIAAIRLSALLVVVAVVAGCASHAHSTWRLFDTPLDRVVAENDRQVKLYYRLDSILILDAVLVDAGLRNAWVDQYAQAHRLTAEEKEALAAEENGKEEKYVTFVLALYTAQTEWNDLAEAHSRWKTTMVRSDGGAVDPVELRSVGVDSLFIRDHLPFNPTFRKFYLVDFPRGALDAAPPTLALSSLLGEVTLTWP